MKSYTTYRNLLQTLSNDTTAASLTLFDQILNDSIRTVGNMRGGKWWWLEDTVDIPTVANQRGYQVPAKFRKIMDVYVTVGSTIYMPEAVFDPNKWKLILAYQMGTSDTPYFYYRDENKIYFAPIPASNGNTITVRGRLGLPDLNIADYTTGTIASIANGATTITGTGTSWNSSMAGRYIRITSSDATNTGDERWYEIGSVTDTTHLEILKPYAGTAISAATNPYIIGQMSRIPEAFDMLPVYRTLAIYWTRQGNAEDAQTNWRYYDGGVEAGLVPAGKYGGLVGQMLENESEKVEGVYIPPFASTSNIVNTGAWWSPWQGNASGF